VVVDVVVVFDVEVVDDVLVDVELLVEVDDVLVDVEDEVVVVFDVEVDDEVLVEVELLVEVDDVLVDVELEVVVVFDVEVDDEVLVEVELLVLEVLVDVDVEVDVDEVLVEVELLVEVDVLVDVEVEVDDEVLVECDVEVEDEVLVDVDDELDVDVELVVLVDVDVLLEVDVLVDVELDVLVLVEVVDVGGTPWLSSAPMSQTAAPLALPSTFRGSPRSSVVGDAQFCPASTAGVPDSNRCVCIGPPLLPRICSRAGRLLLSVAPTNPHVVPVSRLEPLSMRVLLISQLSPDVLSAMIVFWSVSLPSESGSPGEKMPPPRLAVLLAIVTNLKLAVASPFPLLLSAPPSVPAVLPLSVTLMSVTSLSFSIAPPMAAAVLLLIVTPVNVATPALFSPAPEPTGDEQPSMVTLVAVSVPSFWMPPAPSRPSQLMTRASVSTSVLLFQMPPQIRPLPEKPLATVSSLIVMVPLTFSWMSNTRSTRWASVAPALMIVDVAPAPSIVIARLMSRSPFAAKSSAPPIVSVNVPAGTVTVTVFPDPTAFAS
jgi:hypothetical protein